MIADLLMGRHPLNKPKAEFKTDAGEGDLKLLVLLASNNIRPRHERGFIACVQYQNETDTEFWAIHQKLTKTSRGLHQSCAVGFTRRAVILKESRGQHTPNIHSLEQWRKSNSQVSWPTPKATPGFRSNSKQRLISMLWLQLPKRRDSASLLSTWKKLKQRSQMKNWREQLEAEDWVLPSAHWGSRLPLIVAWMEQWESGDCYLLIQSRRRAFYCTNQIETLEVSHQYMEQLIPVITSQRRCSITLL